MRAASRPRLPLVLLTALALCRCQAPDPITGQPVAGGAAPEGKPQRREKLSGKRQREKSKKRMMSVIFGDDAEGSEGRKFELPKLAVIETLVGVFVIMGVGVLFSGAI